MNARLLKTCQIKIKSFVPLREKIHKWSQRKKKVMKILIPQMVFIYGTEKKCLEALTLPAISHYKELRGEHTPTIIPDDQIKRFMFLVDYSDETIEMFTSPLEPGQTIKVIKGPLFGLEGELIDVEGKFKVVVRLELLGYAGVDKPAGYVE